MSDCVFNQSAKDKAEADAQIHINGFDEAVGIGKRGPGSHHKGSHS